MELVSAFGDTVRGPTFLVGAKVISRLEQVKC